MKEFIKDIYTCASCGYCKFGCPVNKQIGFESFSAKGRMLILKNIYEKKLPYNNEIIDSIYACSECGNCSQMCPTGINYEEIMTTIKKEIVEMDKLPQSQKIIRNNIEKEYNPFAEKKEERGLWTSKKSTKSKYLYFVGCSASYSSNRIPKSITKILDMIKFDYTILGNDEVCCGDPLEKMGEIEKANNLLKQNIEKIKELEVETIFASCSGCYKNFKKKLSKEFKVKHITELLSDLIKEGKISFKDFSKKVIYADGCDLGRHSGIYEEPRKILKSIPKLELLEFDYNRKESICCGGPLMASYPSLSRKIAAEKIKEAFEKKADLIATSCPTCFVNLKEGAKESGIEIEIQDIPLLLPKLVKS
ncbi:MAG: (Fe-S)-binding protein [bacterium]